jgi:hypothetical protein
MSAYSLVFPRDLFNHAKLLKCLGQLALNLHDMPIDGVTIEQEDATALVVSQSGNSGDLFVSPNNFSLRVHGELCDLSIPYNSRYPYPLWLECEGADSFDVLNDDGTFTLEFRLFVNRRRD